MTNCIQNYAVPKKERDFENTVLTLRLTSAQAVRYWRIMDDAKARNPYFNRSDAMRELLGLTRPEGLTTDEIRFFRTGDKTMNLKPGELNSLGEVHLKEVSAKKRKAG